MMRLAGIFILTALALFGPLRAAQADPAAIERGAAMCERAILSGAKQRGIPSEVLHAISLTETGRNLGGRLRPWPWAINREGQGYWFATRAEALAFAKASLIEGRRSFDVGCFQINYHWHGHNFPSLEAMFDQEVGAAYAARFLKDLHTELGTWTAAAGAYHSRTPEFASRYRARFERVLAGIGGKTLIVAAAEPGVDDAPAVPRKSRTRIGGRPKIITIGDVPVQPDPRAARIATIRIERGRVPPSVEDNVKADATSVVLSGRDQPS